MDHNKNMKVQLLELIEGMEGDGFDFNEDAAMFKWSYKERPDFTFSLVIGKSDQLNLELDTPMQ